MTYCMCKARYWKFLPSLVFLLTLWIICYFISQSPNHSWWVKNMMEIVYLIQLFPDCAPHTVAYILELLPLRHCAGCQFYRAESRGQSWDSEGNHIKNVRYTFTSISLCNYQCNFVMNTCFKISFSLPLVRLLLNPALETIVFLLGICIVVFSKRIYFHICSLNAKCHNVCKVSYPPLLAQWYELGR